MFDERREVANEDSANQRYLRVMKKKVEAKTPIAVSRSAQWTGSGLPIPTTPTVGSLVGRVGLDGHDTSVGGSNFYVGPWHVEEEDLIVFSWAAPVAAAFYGFDDSGFDLEASVAVRRTLSLEGQEHRVTGISDEWILDSTEADPFEARRRLTIPAAPALPSDAQSMVPPEPRVRAVAQLKPAEETDEAPAPQQKLKKESKPIRAEEAVRKALAAPRSKSLPSLLSTLQPDQYDFVTRPLNPSLVIQGHPGTGKTVIASHRAAFLMHPEMNKSRLPPKILLIGPTQYYAKHVQTVLDSLVLDSYKDRCSVMGIGQFLSGLRKMTKRVEGELDATHFEVSFEIGVFADAAGYGLSTSGELAAEKTHEGKTRLVYEALRSNSAGGIDLTEDPDSIRDLRRLPRWEVAVTKKAYFPLITQCAVSHSRTGDMYYDHIIVDEAQDVRPLEWRLLKSRNAGNSWTLLGDMNQRRTDHSYSSWESLIFETEIVEDPNDFMVSQFVRGYRSTSSIMKFANHLLPKEQRLVENIQSDGPTPTVLKVPVREREEKVASELEALLKEHPGGTVAVIATEVKSLQQVLLKRSWHQVAHDKRFWVHGEFQAAVITPEIARGLEFDAVIVVEPSAFPQNLARLGSLYTSLTRANRELVVIHSDQLPDALRQASRTRPK
jgi:hypothetical protein